MAPLPDNLTPCLFIDYTSGGQKHTLLIRLPAAGNAATAATAYGVLAPLMAASMFASDAVTGARFRAANANISFPISVSAEIGDLGGTLDPDRKPNFYSFTGRGPDGRRVTWQFFTPAVDVTASGYRDNTPDTNQLAIISALQGSSVDARTVSGSDPVINGYTNFGANAYYQRKARRT